MMQSLRMAAAAASLALLLPAAQADVLTFEDLPGSLQFFTSDYRGFTFGTNNIQTTAWFYTNDVNAFYKPKSGTKYVATDFQLYNGNNFWEAAQPIVGSMPFFFEGAWFSGGNQVRYDLYVGDVRVFTSADSPELTFEPTFVPSGFLLPITSVVVVGRQGYYAMDDFVYAPIPEPATYGMLLAGLAGIGALVRRKAKA